MNPGSRWKAGIIPTHTDRWDVFVMVTYSLLLLDTYLGGGFKYFLFSSRNLGEMIQFD